MILPYGSNLFQKEQLMSTSALNCYWFSRRVFVLNMITCKCQLHLGLKQKKIWIESYCKMCYVIGLYMIWASSKIIFLSKLSAFPTHAFVLIEYSDPYILIHYMSSCSLYSYNLIHELGAWVIWKKEQWYSISNYIKDTLLKPMNIIMKHMNIIWSPQKPPVRQSDYPKFACAETETEGR